MTGAELLVRALENEGVEKIFGIPGEENLFVVEALRKSSIQLVVTRHEQAAAFMAATYGRLTGKPGVCITTREHICQHGGAPAEMSLTPSLPSPVGPLSAAAARNLTDFPENELTMTELANRLSVRRDSPGCGRRRGAKAPPFGFIGRDSRGADHSRRIGVSP
ncbi:hypothetical protein AGR1B_pAt30113 [Agrobacterium fabacearum S56]|nr:hypothetical protein At1D1108_46560 [Agrobacterium tumefaciens]CUX05456.1 hypothetical protein AGR1B_pAt30113 [Agrobacterium fabacearum S56]